MARKADPALMRTLGGVAAFIHSPGERFFNTMKLELSNVTTPPYAMETQVQFFLMACFLYKSEKINRKKFIAMYRMADDAEALTKIRPHYNCKVNNTWYNDERLVNIYKQVCEDLLYSTDTLTHEDLLDLMTITFNKKRNWLKDWLREQVFIPVGEYFILYGMEQSLYDLLGTKGIRATSLQHHVPFCDSWWCCEDCDGPYENYKRYDWEEKQRRNKEKLPGVINNQLGRKPNPYTMG